ncbi:hypothetical protein [Paraburkholderia hospita]|uniref:hypothetical protein n=1 Tax=Paraburkholderia hospita TaxID=169430 RepID=UPI000B34663A|nr:hypothetical protein [Paraburkholderia hospita]OUL92085.1 hypothetical protein CA601_12510 [Paraburkholderia hospita]
MNAATLVFILIPMGDWCGSVPQPDDEKPGALPRFVMLQDGQLGFQVQGVVPEGNNFSLYSGLPMGDDFTSFLVTTFLRSTLGERRVQASSSNLIGDFVSPEFYRPTLTATQPAKAMIRSKTTA